ncbi:EAL domain-containing protein [Sphingoaurantiacus capsulatus]|uniref:EAL domain-containing protein n=1 Tax=Sphingoaurantiacus capsulatus TaxID=1771310 RepID=A0ABV7X5W8_9SPHN
MAGLVALTVVASVVTLFVSADYYVDLSHDREEVQAQNALDLKLQRLRNDLTSVTFWDEAVQNTALSFDEAWVDENVGQWLHRFYAADRVFMLDAGNKAAYANAKGVQLPASTYAALAAQAAPLVAKVRERADSYRPAADSLTIGRNLSRGYDDAAFAMIDGRPVFLIVAPILHDFGRVGTPADGGYALLVSAYDVDEDFLASLSDSVLIDRMSLAGWPARAAPGDGELVLRNASDQRIAVLHWRAQRHMGDVVERLLPFAMVVLLVMTLAGILVYRFIRSSAHDLSITRHEARHDELTGLANRRLLMEKLGEAVAAKGGGATLLFVDLDGFKDVNDMWGHEAGDKVLRTVGRRIRRLFPGDTVARFGGDEFVVLIADSDVDAARSRATGLLAALTEPHNVEGTQVRLSGSIGIAAVQGSDTSPDEVVRRADIALYQAKSRGRSRVALFEAAMDEDLHHRRRIEGELRRAIDGDAVKVVYQPKVCARTQRIVGVEALARFVDADGRPVSPSVFVPIAEESGLIAGLGERVLRTACADAARWSIGVAVNLSPAQFRGDDIVDTVKSALESAGLDPARLTLEITETVLVNDPEGARRRLDALRAMGVKLALDDFGTGYSSLVYLQRFKLDSMKIAQGFLEGLAPDTDAMTVLSSMVALGHALGLTVVAEGVETVRQVELLKRAGADEFQGNVFAEPMSRAVLEAMLASGDGAVIPLRQAATRA